MDLYAGLWLDAEVSILSIVDCRLNEGFKAWYGWVRARGSKCIMGLGFFFLTFFLEKGNDLGLTVNQLGFGIGKFE